MKLSIALKDSYMIHLANILQPQNWNHFGNNPFNDKLNMGLDHRVERMQSFDVIPFMVAKKTL